MRDNPGAARNIPVTPTALRPGLIEPVTPEMLAETRAFNAHVERVLAAMPATHEVPAEQTRKARREGRGVFPAPVFLPQARDRTIQGRAGAIRLRILAPEGPARGVYLHIHGGGWTLGASDLQDPALWELVQATGLCAVSVDYRLSPEHPHPAGAEDCEDAARWLVEHGAAELGVTGPLCIGGESAGAHLSVLTLLRLRDRGMGGAFRAANLVFGAYDLSLTPSGRRWGDRNLIISVPVMRFFIESFLPGTEVEARRAPDISPLYADLQGLPPALFTVGTLDPLLDDSLFMDARWRAAGLRSELRVWPEAIHGFNAFPTAMAKAANAAQYAFLNAQLEA
jgi:acetyl esterase/lipase